MNTVPATTGIGGMADAYGLGPYVLCVWVQVPHPRPYICGYVGIGRQARMRVWWANARVSSSLSIRTKAMIKVDVFLVVMWLYKDTRETTPG